MEVEVKPTAINASTFFPFASCLLHPFPMTLRPNRSCWEAWALAKSGEGQGSLAICTLPYKPTVSGI